MRFVTFKDPDGVTHFGFLTSSGRIADLRGAIAAQLATSVTEEEACRMAASAQFQDCLAFIQGGDSSLEVARKSSRFVEESLAKGFRPPAPAGERFVFEASEVALLAPLPTPPRMICAGKNFLEHAREVAPDENPPERPASFAKSPGVVIGPEGVIPYPEETAELDYEVEMAIVIGKPAFGVAEEQAYDYVFGYAVFNDITARDVMRQGKKLGGLILGKNFPGFAPLGPYLCTRDEVNDPQGLRLRCLVNGEVRQDSSLAKMMFKIDELIAYWSQEGLQAGDVLSTGTPSGSAAGRPPGESPWWLRPGDVVEAEVEGLGKLRSYVR